jgi:predicted transcriptional regulator of viral defense system
VPHSDKDDPKTVAILDQISSLLKQHGKPVLMPSEFRSLLVELLPKKTKLRTVEKILEQVGVIRKRVLKSDNYEDIKRIAVPSLEPTPYHYAISLRSEAYLSHASAVYLLGLTQQQPKTVYVNKEQSSKLQPEATLSQESIDRAFSRPQRRSNYVYRIDGFQIVLLSGKATGRAGVVDDPQTGLPMTCLERTLIDMTVRPRYAGGVFQVSQAFKEAIKEIDISKLVSLLRSLNYRYPYHQALGFYLERAGANNSMLVQLRDLGLHFNFYLDYSMANPAFDKSWRVFYPLGV